MSLKENVFSVLVVSGAESFNSAMSSMLPRYNYGTVVYANNIAAAQRKAAERDFDFIIINSPLTDDMGIRFAIDSAAAQNTIVLLLINNEIHAEVYEKVEKHGVFTLSKPMTKQMMDTALQWMKTSKIKLNRFEKKTTSIEEKMKEIRTANKAKWLLIEKENMTEPEAHRYLEKQAMDRCISKSEIANEIINKYQ